MGVPAHDERDFAFAKKYDLPIKQVVARRRQDLLDRRLAGVVRRQERGVLINSGKYDGLDYEAAVDAIAADLTGAGPRRQADHLAPARLGHLAPALLGHADPDHPLRRPAATCRCRKRTCRWCCRKTCVPDGTGNPLDKHEGVPERAPARTAASRRSRETDTMDTFVDSSWYFMRYCLAGRERRDGRRSAPTTGCRWTSTSAASSTPSCTCCTRASGPR